MAFSVKHLTTTIYQRFGVMIQCLNENSLCSQTIQNLKDTLENIAYREYSLFSSPSFLLKRVSTSVFLGTMAVGVTFASNHIDDSDRSHGVAWKTEKFQNHRYVSVEINLDHAHLAQEMINPETGENYGSFSQLKKAHQAQGQSLLFAINSGIYTKEFTPLGLYIESGKKITPLNRIKSNRGKGNFSLLPNGVFYITKDNRAGVLDTDRFDTRFAEDYGNIRDAVQSGPMLIINGEYNPYFIPKSDSYRIRSGVCALNQGQDVVFVVTEDSVNFYEFARFFKEKLHCDNALYLDGTLARIYHQGHVYGASFWQAKPLVGIWSISQKRN